MLVPKKHGLAELEGWGLPRFPYPVEELNTTLETVGANLPYLSLVMRTAFHFGSGGVTGKDFDIREAVTSDHCVWYWGLYFPVTDAGTEVAILLPPIKGGKVTRCCAAYTRGAKITDTALGAMIWSIIKGLRDCRESTDGARLLRAGNNIIMSP